MIEDIINRGIIEPAELQSLMASNKDHLKILDATFVLPGDLLDPEQEFKARRIDNAQLFDIQATANPDTNIPNMLPIPPDFERVAIRLGISNDDMIVVYAQHGMVMGPARVWWMFRTFGHDRIAVLNGGLPAWESEGYPVNTDLPSDEGSRGTFTATYRPELVYSLENVMNAVENSACTIMDARSPERFSGQSEEPRPNMRAGHIPGSCNIPAKSLIDSQSGKLKPRAEIENIFKSAGCEDCTELISTCGSGVTACMIALALYNLGKKNVPVYDGSWSEWGSSFKKTPVKTL